MRMHTLYTYICWQVTATITATFKRVYIRLYIFEMPLLIENPADCEKCSVIRYFSAKDVKAVEIHLNICEVYGMVCKWVRAFKDGQKNVHDKERSVRPSVISDDLLQKVRKK